MKVYLSNEIGTRLPIKSWEVAGHPLIEDAECFEQFRNLANHPLTVGWIVALPDAHLGYGAPIGSAFTTVGGVIPQAVGVDIGCSMTAIKTGIDADSVSREQLEQLRQAIHARVPVGMAHHRTARTLPPELRDVPGPIVAEQLDAAAYQVGTLGGGNHFIELQRDSDLGGNLWLMLHSGSRNVGLKVCTYYNGHARRYMEMFHIDAGKDLAFLPEGVPEYEQYLAEMRWAMAFAEANHEAMLDAVFAAFKSVLGHEPDVELRVQTHHNFAAIEHHYGNNSQTHRKGAVKASGYVTIPGSMGTASYICEGLNPSESFNSCSHGAGRVIGRKAAKQLWTGRHEEAVKLMEHVVFGIREGDYDELPTCYKDVDAVIRAQADLVRPVYRLTPLAVVKG